MRKLLDLFPSSKIRPFISTIGVLALTFFSVVVIFEATRVEVVFADNGENQTIKTHADTVEDLLAEIGITVGTYDKLSHDIDTAIKDGMEIEFTTAKKVKVSMDGVEETINTTTDTVEDFLNEQHLSLSKYDDLSHEKDAEITNGMNLEIVKAFPIIVKDGKKKPKKLMTTGGKVKDLLEKENIDFDEDSDDKLNVKLADSVKKNMDIIITRVQTETIEEVNRIPYQTVKENDSNLTKGKEKEIKAGKEGLLVKKVKVTKENGKIADKKVIDEKVEKEAVDRIVAVGTKEQEPIITKTSTTAATPTASKPKQDNRPSKSTSSKSENVLYMDASAYTASCNGCSGYTSTGINIKDNPNKKVVAVDPSVIPLDSTVWVEGYGTAIAGDTGGSIVGHRIDLHFPTKNDAYAFGRKKVKVKILK